uniref:Uncharacterized protein n=1 Tax=Romanomermis culicivorax TaxID=13658 RepID=A0A915I2D2_ROMCU
MLMEEVPKVGAASTDCQNQNVYPKRDQIIGYAESMLFEDDDTYKKVEEMEKIKEEKEYQTCMMDLPNSFFKLMLVEWQWEQCYAS